MNNYVFISIDNFLLEKEMNSFIEEKNIDPFNVIKYDFAEANPLEILSDLQTISFLGEKKLIVITNPIFLKSTYKNEDIIDKFTNYFTQKEVENYLLILSDFEPDYTLQINSILKVNAEINKIGLITGEKLKEWIDIELKKDNYVIDSYAKDELIERTQGDILTISNELKKLMLYEDKGMISLETVKTLVPRNLDDNIFNLLSAFLVHDKRKVLSIYNDFMTLNQDEIWIMNAFSNKLEEILYTKTLMRQGLGKDEIASYFRCKPGRAYYMMENAKNMNDKALMELINSITKLDADIKTGKIDKKLGLQLFILGAI